MNPIYILWKNMKKQATDTNSVQFNSEFEYTFWFWKDKSEMVINLLALLIDYNLVEGELEGIIWDIRVQNSEKLANWSGGLYYGKKDVIYLKLAKGEDNDQMIYAFIAGKKVLKDRVEFIDLIQNNYKLIER
jgi:hypothetical protein